MNISPLPSAHPAHKHLVACLRERMSDRFIPIDEWRTIVAAKTEGPIAR